ncbi:hypothetical protein BLNAU_1084 [Blattamonas nauphoetae]|uniref:Uncharacterized protein n=1 Tax=Blattamonas nauphoetae TaxID=2049346 RepID=A0ABQ9YJT3_9EUKA|nr:hypothetical protein BLNAU_1084 [Blattamonas nauphoetae]
MFEYSFGLQTQEVVELLTFKPFELQLLFEFVDEEQYQTHSISSSILFLNHSEEIVKLCGDDSTTISFIAQILTLSITNSSDIVAEYSSAGQITFSESMLELDKTNEPEQAPNVHGFASFSGLLFENRWEDFIRVNEAILAVVERVQRRTRLDGSELAFPPLIQTDLLSEVTTSRRNMNRSSYYLFRFCNDLFRSSCTFGPYSLHLSKGTHNSFFVRVIAQICVSASKLATDLDWNQVFRPHLLLSPPYKGSPPFTPLPVSCLFSDVPNIDPKLKWFLTSYTLSSTERRRFCTLPSFRLAAHCHPSLPLLPFSTLLQWRLANKVCGAGEVDLCVLTLSSLLTNTHVAVTQFNQESGEGSWSVVDQKATRDKEERKCV